MRGGHEEELHLPSTAWSCHHYAAFTLGAPQASKKEILTQDVGSLELILLVLVFIGEIFSE